MNCVPIVPAIIPRDKDEVIKFSEVLTFSKEFHLDLVDGRFVPTVSWPFDPSGDPLQVKSHLDSYTLEIDLMVENPINVAKQWLTAGADMLVFHVETLPLDVFKDFVNTESISIGISAHGDTTLDTLTEYCEYADYIQLMGIREIGSQGQKFDKEVLAKIVELKKIFPYKSITIDGSVNSDTIVSLREAGADRFICGSAIVLQDDPELAHKSLSELINHL